MNESRTDRILRLLFRAGRRSPSREAPPFFQMRLMAAIRERQSIRESSILAWNRAAWRLMPVMAAIGLLFACASILGTAREPILPAWTDPLGLELALADYIGGSP